MQTSYFIISTFIVSIPLVLSTSTFLLVPHRSWPLLLWTTRGKVYKRNVSSWYPQVDSKMSAPTFSDFTVHVFVNHDPFIAVVLLPDLFSEFSDSIWRLPQILRLLLVQKYHRIPYPNHYSRSFWSVHGVAWDDMFSLKFFRIQPLFTSFPKTWSRNLA